MAPKKENQGDKPKRKRFTLAALPGHNGRIGFSWKGDFGKYNWGRCSGRCKASVMIIPHFLQMKLPKSITIYVVDSDEVDKNFQINIETLVRKLLNIFAQNHAMFAPIHSRLAEEVC